MSKLARTVSAKPETENKRSSPVNSQSAPIPGVQQSIGNQWMQTLAANSAHASTMADVHSYLQRFKTGSHLQNGARIHQNHQSDGLLQSLNSAGAAVGQDVLLSNRLVGNHRQSVLDHELRHVDQVAGKETDLTRPLSSGSQRDQWESNASQRGEVRTGADPQVVRLYDPNESSSEPGVCSVDDSPSSSTLYSESPNASSVESSTLESVESSSSDSEALSSEPNYGSCEPEETGASFDPNAIDVPAMTNEELNAESIRVDAWFTQHGESSNVDKPAYTVLRNRLKTERTERVLQGHLWLMRAEPTSPTELLMLVAQGNQSTIVSVNLSYGLGPVNESPPGPIMTRTQFDAHLAGLGVEVISEEEYQRRLNPEAQQSSMDQEGGNDTDPYGVCVDPSLSVSSPGSTPETPDPFTHIPGRLGYRTTQNLNLRDRYIAEAMFRQDINQRSGALAEAYLLTGPGTLYGFGSTDYNNSRLVYSGDPLRPFRQTWGNSPVADAWMSYGPFAADISSKMSRPGTTAASSPSQRTQFGTYLEGHHEMLDTSSNRFQQFMDQSARGRTPQQVADQFRLAIPGDHYDDYVNFLRNPTGFDATDTGNTSTTRNYDQQAVRNIYEHTNLAEPIRIQTSGGEVVIRNGADLYAARNSIGAAAFDTHIQTVANTAAGQVMPNLDFDANVFRNFQGFEEQLHPSLRPTMAMFGTIPDRPVYHSSGRRSSTAASSSSSIVQMQNYLNRIENTHITSTNPLHVDAADVAPLQTLLRDPTGFDLTPSGTGRSSIPNHQRASVRRAYDAALSRQPVTGPNGQTFTSVQAILDAGFGQTQLNNMLRDVGNTAANQIAVDDSAARARHDADLRTWTQQTQNVRDQYDAARIEAQTRRHGAFSSEVAEAVRHGSFDQSGRFIPNYRTPAHRAGLHSGAASAGLAPIMDYLTNPNADLNDPEYQRHLAMLTAREGTLGYASGATEQYVRSRVGVTLAERGTEMGLVRAGSMRVGARVLPGVFDMVAENYDMETNNREELEGERLYRSVSAAGKGIVSAEVGLVAGSAATAGVAVIFASAGTGAAAGSIAPGIGTAIGFVVGLGVGIGTYMALDAMDPYNRQYWDERAAREQRERDQQGARERAEAERARLLELYRIRNSFDPQAASVAGRDAMPTYFPVDQGFFECSPESQQRTISNFQQAYLSGYLTMQEQQP